MSERAEWVRANLPLCASAAAAFAAAFPGCRMTYASENGHVIGKPTTRGIRLSETVVGALAGAASRNQKKG